LTLAAAALTLALAQTPAPDGGTARLLTLRDALSLAFDRNLALGRARAEVEAANASRRLARSAVLPRVTFNGSVIRNSTEVSFGPPDDVRTILPLVNWNTNVTVVQPLFAGLRDLKAYRQAGIEIDVAREGLRRTSDEVLLGVAAQFLLALEALALIDVERGNLELAGRRRKQANDLFEAGETTRVDVLRAEADIKAAERRLVEAERTRETALSALRLALALDENLELVSPQEGDVPRLPAEDELLRSALAHRAEVRRAERQHESARIEIEKQRGAYFPVLAADAGFIRQKTTFPRESYGFAALRVNVPIYQGGEVASRVRLAEEREKQAALVLDEVRRVVREDVKLALVDLEASRKNLALAIQQLEAAEAEYRQTSELYQNQELTSLDLQVSEAALSDARRAVATGRLLVAAAEVQVWFAAGTLSEVALRQEPTP
jgi:outer membrane protein